MLKEDQTKELRKVFANFPAVKAVYLFGSRAENKENRYSDLDLGVLLRF
jgi:predicted nucleotidyltransferase